MIDAIIKLRSGLGIRDNVMFGWSLIFVLAVIPTFWIFVITACAVWLLQVFGYHA